MLFLRIAPFAALVAAAAVERAELNEERGLKERGFFGSIFGDVTSAFESGFDHAQATSIAPGVTQVPTHIGKVFATVVTSDGGAAITLAPSESGTTTTFAGHTFTIATGSLNAAPGGIRPFQLTGTMVSSAVTVLSGMAVGVWMTL